MSGGALGRLRRSILAAVAVACAAVALVPVYTNLDFALPVALVILAVFGVSTLAQAVRAPTSITPILTALVVLFLVTAIYARDQALWGFIPTSAAWHEMAETARAGFQDLREVTAPADPSHGLVMLTVVGVACVALLVDLIAVDLEAPAIAGLPLVVLFAVPSVLAPGGVGIPAFVVAITGYLLLLGLSRPGQEHRGRISLGPARIAVGAVVLAVAIPALVPGFGDWVSDRGKTLFRTGGGSTASGLSLSADMRATLATDSSRVILTYRTDDPDPDYLRVATLDRFDGVRFSATASRPQTSVILPSRIPQPTGRSISVPSRVASTSVTSVDFTDRNLPVPSHPTTVTVGGRWYYDQRADRIWTSSTTTAKRTWRITSAHDNPTAAQLRAAQPDANGPGAVYLEVPDSIPDSVRQTADQAVGEPATEYDAAVNIQRYLRTFTYDAAGVPPGPGTPIERFLTSRRGFCQQFAATMALFARIEGIPSRVGVGFTTGTKKNGIYTVVASNAHTWPELWFGGIGWVKFEPTPLSDGTATPPSYTEPSAQPTASTPASPGPTEPGFTDVPPAQARPSDTPPTPGPTDSGTAAPSSGGGETSLPAAALIAILVVALLIAAPALIGWALRARRRRRARSPGEYAVVRWEGIKSLAGSLGHPIPAAATIRATRDQLAEYSGFDAGSRTDLTRLAELVENTRYAPEATPGRTGRTSVGRLADRVERALRRSSSGRARVRARLWPPEWPHKPWK